MKDLLSPKTVARAIGVSESSLKRWCDRGLIPFERTAGGHRRLRLDEVFAFVRKGKYRLQDPQVLGLPAATGQTVWTVARAREQLYRALLEGDEALCLQIPMDLYAAGHPMSAICDQVIAAAFHQIGDRWECGEVEVYEERRACEISVRLLYEFRRVIPQPRPGAPVAFVGTLDGDPYTLAVSMAELVLRHNGWNASSLGHMLPFATIRTAIKANQPDLFCLSVSVIRDRERFVDEVAHLFAVANQSNTLLVLGGAAVTREIQSQLRCDKCCSSLTDLELFLNDRRTDK